MSERNVADDWKLEETGETLERWKLQAAEQNAVAPWQLQDPNRGENAWQPIDYNRDRGGAGNWILPSLVILSFVAVVAYMAWIGLTRLGLLSPTAQATAEPTAVAAIVTTPAVADPVVGASDALTPTATTEPTQAVAPTPIIEPTVTPVPTVVQLIQQFVVITDTAGVNARSEPNTTSAVVQLLNAGQRFLVAEESNGWLQIALAPNQIAWVAADVVSRTSELVTLDLANQRRGEYGLPPLAAPSTPSTTAGAPVTGTVPVTVATGLTNPLGIALSPPAPITATISITDGLNARSEPALDGDVVTLLPGGASYRVVSRSPDSQWLQVRLTDGTLAWVFAQLVTINGDATTLPLPGAQGAITTTLPTTSTAILTPTVVATPATTSTVAAGAATATVSSLSGARARPVPDREIESADLYPFEAVLPVVGRSADNEWVQVELEPGRLAWILVSAVQLNVDLATLPVVATP